jgi:hypothetical protein
MYPIIPIQHDISDFVLDSDSRHRWLSDCVLSSPTVNQLHKSCRQLKEVFYNAESRPGVEPYIDRPPTNQMYRVFPGNLPAFHNLRHLTLLNVTHDIPKWSHHISQVLLNSPGLAMLELSISFQAMTEAFYNNRSELYMCFFDRLCDNYANAWHLHDCN